MKYFFGIYFYFLCLVLGLVAPLSARAGGIAGEWRGTYDLTAGINSSASYPVTLLVELTATGFSGSYLQENPNYLYISTFTGVVETDGSLTFSITQTVPSGNCTGTFTGTGTISGDVLAISFSGSDCLGSHAGTMRLDRVLALGGITDMTIAQSVPAEFTYDSTVSACGLSVAFRAASQEGYPISGLTSTDLTILEDNGAVDPESLVSLTSSTSLHVSFLLDASYSVYENGLSESMKNVAQGLEDYLGTRASFRYYAFAGNVQTISSISSLVYDSTNTFSSLYDGIYEAMQETITQQDQSILVVFTDGEDNHSIHTVDEIAALAAANNIRIYTVGLNSASVDALASVAENGTAIPVSSPAGIAAVYGEISLSGWTDYTATYLSPVRSGEHAVSLVMDANGVSSNSIDGVFTVTSGACTGFTLLAAPVITVSVSGTTVTAGWTGVTNARGYQLFYAPFPDATSVYSIDMANQIGFSADLNSGDAYYVGVKAYAGSVLSPYSNIEQFTVP